jgi:DNA-binding beta-propeller fold protein YncE
MGAARGVAISPDGKYVAYVLADKRGQSLQLRQVATTSNVELVPPASAGLWPVRFSRDGNYIYHESQSSLYQIPVLGGPPRKLMADVTGPLALSPDDREVAVIRQDSGAGEI